MKLSNYQGHSRRFVTYGILICSILCTGFFLNHITLALYASWAPLILVTVLLCSRKSNTLLDANNRSLSCRSSTINIMLWQIALFFSFLLFHQLALRFFNISNTDLLSSNKILQYGLFPWPAIAIISSGLAYIAYKLKKTAYFSSLLSHSHSLHYSRSALSDIGNASFGLLSAVSISLTLGLLSIAFGQWFFSDILAIKTGWQINTIATIIITFFIQRTFLSKAIQKLMHKRKTNFAITITVYTVISGMIIGVLLGASQIILAHTTLPSFNIITYLTSLNSTHAINVIFTFWWLGWASISILFLAKQYRGISIRRNILNTLCLPIFVSLISLLSYFSPTVHQLIETALNLNILILPFGIISTFGLTYLAFNKLHSNILRSSISPIERIRPTPLRLKSKFFKSISTAQIFLLLNIPGLIAIFQGAYGITAFLFINIISVTSFIILFRQETAETEVNDAE
jgi:hypothetical protein